jgi:hypothetical protein
MVVLLCTRTSSNVWNSIEGLIVLASNSAAQSMAFKNRSSSTGKYATLAIQVRVGTRVLDDGYV